MRLEIQRFWRAQAGRFDRIGSCTVNTKVGAPPKRRLGILLVLSQYVPGAVDLEPITSLLMSGVQDASSLRIVECDFDILKGLRANAVL